MSPKTGLTLLRAVNAFRHGLTLIIGLIAGAGLVTGCMLTGRPAARELAAPATEGYVK